MSIVNIRACVVVFFATFFMVMGSAFYKEHPELTFYCIILSCLLITVWLVSTLDFNLNDWQGSILSLALVLIGVLGQYHNVSYSIIPIVAGAIIGVIYGIMFCLRLLN